MVAPSPHPSSHPQPEGYDGLGMRKKAGEASLSLTRHPMRPGPYLTMNMKPGGRKQVRLRKPSAFFGLPTHQPWDSEERETERQRDWRP